MHLWKTKNILTYFAYSLGLDFEGHQTKGNSTADLLQSGGRSHGQKWVPVRSECAGNTPHQTDGLNVFIELAE